MNFISGEDCNDALDFVSDDGSVCADYSASACDCAFAHCGFADADSACAIECETCDPGNLIVFNRNNDVL